MQSPNRSFSRLFHLGFPPCIPAVSLGVALRLAAQAAVTPVPPDHAERMSKGLQSFDAEVAGILKEHCVKCHGGDKTRGDLDMATREGLLKGGADGPSVSPFHPEASRLLKMLRHEEEPFMPEKKPRLPEDVIRKIEQWILHGAPYSKPLVEGKKPARDGAVVTAEDRAWWSFQPLSGVQPPVVAGRQHPVDRFLEAKAAAKGLKFSPLAERAVLIRRASLDLTGLPPTPEEVRQFVADPAPDAWPRLIDRLLAKPAYGERWARHWMDVARYGESSGFEQDYDRKGTHFYRDFLIRSFNEDLPFQKFVQWQIAGDEYAPGHGNALAATAFLSLGVFPTQITINELERVRYEDMDDMLSTTSSAFLGLTVGCARCHDHKYDPIPTRDYYRMLATFTGTVRSEVDWDMDPEQTKAAQAAWDANHEKLRDAQAAEEARLRKELEAFLAQGADALKNTPIHGWIVPDVEQVKAASGTQMVAQPDGSFLAGKGPAGGKETYEFVVRAPELPLSGLLVEALPDPSLPGAGVGRGSETGKGAGNFQLTGVRVEVLGAGGAVARKVELVSAVADYEQDKASNGVEAARAGKGGGWSVAGKEHVPHKAAFVFKDALQLPADSPVRVVLEFNGKPKQAIGRPRIGFMAGGAPVLDAPHLGTRLVTLLRSATVPTSAAEKELFAQWWFEKDAQWNKKRMAVWANQPTRPTGLTKVLVASESYPPVKYHTAGGSVETYKETFVLKRGNVALKEEVAAPGFLQVLSRAEPARWAWKPPEGATYAGRRRAFAEWILDTEKGAGALAARVMVNRLWHHHFGRGIVPTPNDFGKTGSAPAQPELLDWLAAELLRTGGSLKQMHRVMMTSAAYQQAVLRDAAKEAADPANDLFVRRVPKRLESEAIRDSLLAVSGLLDLKMYGAGDRSEAGTRRSVYFQVKRSQLVGSMVAFDQPEPLVSQGARPTTTVAPQALMLLNNASVRNWMQAFADRVGKETPEGSLPARIEKAYWLALGRAPTAPERAVAEAFIEKQKALYAASDKPAGADRAALADYCQVLCGLNEFAYMP